MKTYLVTGGCGFIGSNFIHYLFKTYNDDIKVINLDKLTYAGNEENLKEVENRENYFFIKGDICDEEYVNSIFKTMTSTTSYTSQQKVMWIAQSFPRKNLSFPMSLEPQPFSMPQEIHGSWTVTPTRTAKNTSRYPPMKSTDLLATPDTSPKPRRLILTAPTPHPKHPRT